MQAPRVNRILGTLLRRFSVNVFSWQIHQSWQGVSLPILAIAAVCLCQIGSAGADCVDYGDYVHWLDHLPMDHAGNIVIVGAYGYVGGTLLDSGFHILDLSFRGRPRVVGSVDDLGDVYGVAVSGALACVAGGNTGFMVINISNPAHPRLVGGMDTVDNASGVALSDAYVFVADCDAGLQVLPIQCDTTLPRLPRRDSPCLPSSPAATMLRAAHPNPFNPAVTIPFSLSCRQRVRLAVYDLAGRRVRTLADRIFARGVSELFWRGRDDAGRAAPTGVYFLVMESAGCRESQKLVILP